MARQHPPHAWDQQPGAAVYSIGLTLGISPLGFVQALCLIAAVFYSNSAIPSCMKANVTITGRGVITLPVKLRQALRLKAD